MLREGIRHRDLKPDNILIKNGIYKIADFGFAKQTMSSKFKNRTRVGSPFYMSLQTLQGKTYSSKADMWSLGIILYEMLHGNRQGPWQVKT